MKRSSWKRLFFLGAVSAAALTLSILTRCLGAGKEAPAPNAAARKPVKGPAAVRLADFSKSGIEQPTETLLVNTSATLPEPARKAANPHVQPGKVAWHATFEQACAAAKRSGKPVLLFSMMGRLDEKFC